MCVKEIAMKFPTRRTVRTMLMTAIAIAMLAIVARAVLSAQDKYTLKVPGGLAFAEFRGYEDWAW
jgi:hypothetical protein